MIKDFLAKVSASKKGFTLIEILVVIGIIAILAAIVIIAINPAKQFAQARNTQRESDVSTILNAIGQNIADNKGIFGGVCTVSLVGPISSTSIDSTTGGTGINLSCLTPTYIPSSIPRDPAAAVAGAATGYTIAVDSVGRTTVCAPNHAETAVPAAATYCLTR